MLHNFGGNISLFGRIETVATQPAAALADPTSGQLKGIGLTMEGIEQNPVLYELMTSHTWRNTPIDLNEWLKSYIRNRYGKTSPELEQAWQVLVRTVYNGQAIRDGAESIIAARPTFDGFRRWARTKLNYAPEDLLPAWDLFVKAIPECEKSDGFVYDLVDLTRQVLANYALPVQQEFAEAYQTNDKAAFDRYTAEYLDLIDDLDRLLATRKDFLLGPWLAGARSWGQTPEEKALYEQNARDLITLWGDAGNRLHEYSCRQWSGLLSDFYKPRWEQFIGAVKSHWGRFDQAQFDNQIKQWEWQWVTSRKDFPVEPSGDATIVAAELYKKYRDRIVPLTKQMKPIQYDIDMGKTQTAKPERFLSLDVFRGLTIALMIVVNTPGTGAHLLFIPVACTVVRIYVGRFGFPSFLFAMGNAMSFSMSRLRQASGSVFYTKVLKRTIIIFLLGFLMYWFPFFQIGDDGAWMWKPLAETRIMGVLQRIALCYFFASVMIRYFSEKQCGLFPEGPAGLLGYFVLVWPAGRRTGDGNQCRIASGFSLLGPKHMYRHGSLSYDPEGILSTFPAIVNVVVGYLAGAFIQQKGKSFEGIARLLMAGFLLTSLALWWNLVFPMAKRLWTSSFVLYTVGIDLSVMAILGYAIEMQKMKIGVTFFDIFGKNPLFIYLFSELFYVVLRMVPAGQGMDVFEWISERVFQVMFPGHWGPWQLRWRICFCVGCWDGGLTRNGFISGFNTIREKIPSEKERQLLLQCKAVFFLLFST
jgi:predicted acyltransferase